MNIRAVIGSALLTLNMASLCGTPALAGQTFPIPSLSSLSHTDNAAYRAYIAKGIADVPCVKVDSKELARAEAQVRADMKSGIRDYATCPDGSLTLVGYKPTHIAVAPEKPRENSAGTAAGVSAGIAPGTDALTAATNALTSALTAANIGAFNDTLAARSVGCQETIGMINMIPNPYLSLNADALITWSKTADAAKVCSIKVHEETSAPAPAQLPQAVLKEACAWLEADFAKKPTEAMEAAGIKYDFRIYISRTSWACGWPAPLPEYRTVPSE